MKEFTKSKVIIVNPLSIIQVSEAEKPTRSRHGDYCNGQHLETIKSGKQLISLS